MSRPHQEVLFLHDPTSTAEIPRDIFGEGNEGEARVQQVEQAILLIDTLDLIAESNKRQGFVKSCYTPEGYAQARERYGRNTTATIEGAKSLAAETMVAAKWSFARATGFFEKIDSGEFSLEEVREETREWFSAFAAEFGEGKASVSKRKELRELLESRIQDAQDDITIANREQGQRAYKKDNTFKREKEPIPSPAERLRVIKADPRAGFLPTTHKEKNIVLSWLDYLDNPDYPLGINEQLNEVFTHAQKVSRTNAPNDKAALRGVASGKRALESITYEIVDFYEAARDQGKALADLQIKIANCPNPNVTLQEEVGDDHPGYAPLIRYLDLQEMIEKASDPDYRASFSVPLNPLRTRENRWAKSAAPGRHKIVQDEYTATDVDPFYEDRVVGRVSELTIGELRIVINKAITDQLLREHFMKSRLEDLELAENRRAQSIIRDIARQALATTSETAA